MEQRANLRNASSKGKSRFASIAKAVILRRSVIVHLMGLLPAWKALITELTGWGLYKNEYRLEPDGSEANGEDDNPEGELETEKGSEEAVEEVASTYKSRPMLAKRSWPTSGSKRLSKWPAQRRMHC